MAGLALVFVVILAVIVALLFGAVVEFHRQLLQLRQHVGLVDTARGLKWNLDARYEDVAGAEGGLRNVVLVLSDSCSTCADIAVELAQLMRPELTVLIEGRSDAEAIEWLSRFDLAPSDQIIIDRGGERAQQTGVTVTPAAIRFERGSPVSAHTVPSVRQLRVALDWLADAGQSDIPTTTVNRKEE